jgi:hypothetical protein
VKRKRTILDPLQSPCFGTRFRNRMMGHPTFKSSFANGIQDKSNEFKYSGGYAVWVSTPASIVFQSTLQKVWKTP